MKPRVSMRTVLWTFALAAILAGWMADRHRMEVRRRQDAIAVAKADVRAAAAEAQFHALKLERLRNDMGERAELSRENKIP